MGCVATAKRASLLTSAVSTTKYLIIFSPLLRLLVLYFETLGPFVIFVSSTLPRIGGDIFGPECFFRRQNAGVSVRLRDRFRSDCTNPADDGQSVSSEGAWTVGERERVYGFFVI